MIHVVAKFEEANFSPGNIFILKAHQMCIHQIPWIQLMLEYMENILYFSYIL